MEQKLVSLVEKLKGDEKQGLERERRLMEQVQDGLNTMNEIIKGTKEQNQVNFVAKALSCLREEPLLPAKPEDLQEAAVLSFSLASLGQTTLALLTA